MYLLKRALWLLVAGSVLFAIVRGFPVNNPAAVWAWLQEQGVAFKQLVDHIVGKIPVDQLGSGMNPIHLPGAHSSAAPASNP
jgi:hypothetical protein